MEFRADRPLAMPRVPNDSVRTRLCLGDSTCSKRIQRLTGTYSTTSRLLKCAGSAAAGGRGLNSVRRFPEIRRVRDEGTRRTGLGARKQVLCSIPRNALPVSFYPCGACVRSSPMSCPDAGSSSGSRCVKIVALASCSRICASMRSSKIMTALNRPRPRHQNMY